MHNQSMGGPGEILNVKWATDDPNPGVVKAEARRAVHNVRQALVTQGVSLTDAPYHHPPEYHVPAPRPGPAGPQAHHGYPPQHHGYPPQHHGYPPQQMGHHSQHMGYPPHMRHPAQPRHTVPAPAGPASRQPDGGDRPPKRARGMEDPGVCEEYPDTDAQYASSAGIAPYSTVVPPKQSSTNQESAPNPLADLLGYASDDSN